MNRIEALCQAGQVLYGPAWQSNLARALGPFYPSKPRECIDDRLVRRWAAGQRPIPNWVFSAIVALLHERQKASDAIIIDIKTLVENE